MTVEVVEEVAVAEEVDVEVVAVVVVVSSGGGQ